MSGPTFVGEHSLGRNASGADASLVAFVLPSSVKDVSYFSDEVVSFCPVTGQPDFYNVDISLLGTTLGLESKSIKLYLQKYNDKDLAQFCEQFAETIAQDVLRAVTDKEAQGAAPEVAVRVDQKARGGIAVTARALIERTYSLEGELISQ